MLIYLNVNVSVKINKIYMYCLAVNENKMNCREAIFNIFLTICYQLNNIYGKFPCLYLLLFNLYIMWQLNTPIKLVLIISTLLCPTSPGAWTHSIITWYPSLTFFFLTHWILSILLIWACVWGHPLREPTEATSLVKMDTFFLSSNQFPIIPGMGGIF